MAKTIIALIALMLGSALFYRSFPEDGQTDNAPKNQFSGGTYKVYDPTEIIDSGNIVLFFHADWCPTCVAFEKKVIKS
jgi:thiol-disulfide isomerase/thioredoxin